MAQRQLSSLQHMAQQQSAQHMAQQQSAPPQQQQNALALLAEMQVCLTNYSAFGALGLSLEKKRLSRPPLDPSPLLSRAFDLVGQSCFSIHQSHLTERIHPLHGAL